MGEVDLEALLATAHARVLRKKGETAREAADRIRENILDNWFDWVDVSDDGLIACLVVSLEESARRFAELERERDELRALGRLAGVTDENASPEAIGDAVTAWRDDLSYARARIEELEKEQNVYRGICARIVEIADNELVDPIITLIAIKAFVQAAPKDAGEDWVRANG